MAAAAACRSDKEDAPAAPILGCFRFSAVHPPTPQAAPSSLSGFGRTWAVRLREAGRLRGAGSGLCRKPAASGNFQRRRRLQPGSGCWTPRGSPCPGIFRRRLWIPGYISLCPELEVSAAQSPHPVFARDGRTSPPSNKFSRSIHSPSTFHVTKSLSETLGMETLSM